MPGTTPAPVEFAPEGPGFLQILLLLLLLVLILIGVYFATRFFARFAQRGTLGPLPGGGKGQRRRRIVLLDRLVLDRDRSVVLLESEGRRYLLGVGGQSFALLDKADAPKEEEPEQSAARERSAAGTFRDVMAVWKRQENGENAPEE